MNSRDPYPPTKLENDFTLSGYKAPPLKVTYNKPTHMAQTEEPWSRLHDSATHSSFRRTVFYDQQAPRDSLDFQLKTVYDHHKDLFSSKNQILCQGDTVCEEHRHTEKQGDKGTDQDQDIRRWVYPQRCSIYSIK